MDNKKTKDILNQTVADLSQFAAIIHQAHWYMRGGRFYLLHPKMDEFMDEINEHLDQFAERLITIGGQPYSTLEEFKANTKLKEKKGSFSLSMDQHLQTVLDGYKYLAGLYKNGIDTAGEDGDDVTEDLYTSLKAPIDKEIWMLSATLRKGPQ